MTGIIIYGILIVIGTGMIFMLTIRVLFFDAFKEADPMAIDAMVARLKRGEELRAQGRLGWLQEFVDDARGDLPALRRSIEDFRCKVERFHPTLRVAANTAMGIGFFGTVASIASMAGGRIELPIIIGVGMQSTMVGLVIAQPGIAYHGLTDSKVMRFLDQIDAVLEALDGRINPPTSSTPVEPPSDLSIHIRPAQVCSSSNCPRINPPLPSDVALPLSIEITDRAESAPDAASLIRIEDIAIDVLMNTNFERVSHD